MARLLDALRGSSTRYSLAEYAQQMASFVYQGNLYSPPYSQTNPGQLTEQLQNDFVSMVRGAYYDNGIVFACMLARRAVFMEGRFQWRQIRSGRLGDYFGTPGLQVLETPWQGAGTDDLLARMIDDVDLAGNAYVFRENGTANEVIRLRPDYVDIALLPRVVGGNSLGYKKVGYVYWEGGDRTGTPAALTLDEVAHWAPIPDPLASYRGMSWLTPVAREIMGDRAASIHKLKFFDQGATPNMIVKVSETMSIDDFKEFMEIFDADSSGLEQAYKTLFLGGGADVEVVGKDFQQMDFKSVQGAGETRIASAAGVPPVIAGFSEGLAGSSLNTGNYNAARRNFADRTLRPLWRSISTSMQQIVPAPGGSKLAIDTRDVAFLSEDAEISAGIQQTKAITIRNLLDAGYDADSVVDAVLADDLGRLQHSGLFSVQLQPPGTTQPTDAPPTDGGGPPDGTDTPAA